MNVEQFEEQLRTHLRRVPFQPFVVELLDGRVISVDAPSIAFDEGEAGYLTAEYDLIIFKCDEVRSMREAAHEMSS